MLQFMGSQRVGHNLVTEQHDRGILLPGFFWKKKKTLIKKDICTPRIIATLFTIALFTKSWEQS